MILDLRTIKRSGKDSEEFYFEYFPEKELLEIPTVEMQKPVRIEGTITLTGTHSAYIEGEIVFSAKGECTRCLKESVNEYLFNFNEEVFENNEEGYSVTNDKIDLTEIVDDTIMTNFPMIFLCKEDCKGICSGCGVNLNDEQCKCEK